MLDLIIKGGTLVDGSGGEPYTGDLGIRDGRIVEVGTVNGTAKQTIDADGAIVTPGFTDIPQVINGCSDLMVDVFGEAGRHARSAVSCPELPLGVAVEVDGIFEIAD